MVAHLHLPSWLSTLYLPGVGPCSILRWLEPFSDINALLQASPEEMLHQGVPRKWIEILKQDVRQQVEKDLAWMQQREDHHILCLDDEDYPPLLRNISDPPLVLFLLGDRSALTKPQIAMVGSRHATPSGLKNAEKFAFDLVQAGFAVTSGLALGIDGACHRGALLAGGVTIGVSGTGLNHMYPRAHLPLMKRIIQDQGAVISEFPLALGAHPTNFPRRNRTIGGLSLGVVVVEAAVKSGSLITARHALEQGREVFAIPGCIHNPLAKGCHHLIRQGAKLVETVVDILEELPAFKRETASNHKETRKTTETKETTATKEKEIDLHPLDKQILEQIHHETTPGDMIIWRSGLTPSEVSSILLKLELKGYIQSVSGGYIRTI